MTATTPPLPPLLEAVARLERAGIACALGGSGLLAALGLVDHVRDWDLTTEADVEDLARLFADRRHEVHGSGGGHADHKLVLLDDGVDVIARFAFETSLGVVRIPCLAAGRWQGVPLARPETWAVAYALLAQIEGSERRRQRSELLFAHLQRQGADSAAIGALLAEPLDDSLAKRLRALPRAIAERPESR